MARTFREFTPANARSRSSYKRAVLAAMGMYDLGTDVGEAMRHNAGRKTDGLFHTAPTYPAIPIYANVKVWEFVTAYDINSTSVWKQTATGSGTALTVQDQNGGVAKVINGTVDNNYYFYESVYEIAKLTSGKDIWLRAKIAVSDATQSDLFVGLCARLGSGDLWDNRVDAIGFYKDDGDTNIDCECRKDSAATAETAIATLTASATALTKYGIHVIGTTSAEFFVDDVWKKTITTNLPDDEEMCFSFGLRNGEEAAKTLYIGRTVLIMDE